MDPHSDPRTAGTRVTPDATRAWLYRSASDATARAARYDEIGREHRGLREICRLLAEQERMAAGTNLMLATVMRPTPRPWWSRLWRRLRRM